MAYLWTILMPVITMKWPSHPSFIWCGYTVTTMQLRWKRYAIFICGYMIIS